MGRNFVVTTGRKSPSNRFVFYRKAKATFKRLDSGEKGEFKKGKIRGKRLYSTLLILFYYLGATLFRIYLFEVKLSFIFSGHELKICQNISILSNNISLIKFLDSSI